MGCSHYREELLEYAAKTLNDSEMDTMTMPSVRTMMTSRTFMIFRLDAQHGISAFFRA